MSRGATAKERVRPRERDQRRSASLLLDAELRAGELSRDALATPSVRRATRVRRIPPRPVRVLEQLLYKAGRLDFERAVVRQLLDAREAVLGSRAPSPPRFLIRVDEFPHYLAWDRPERFGTAAFARFHEIMRGAGAAYLIAVLPRVSRAPLSPAPARSPSQEGSRSLQADELQQLRELVADGVGVGLHGLDHRTRFASPRRHSELVGLSGAQTEALLDEAQRALADAGLRPDVFVAPYNRFEERQLAILARRFAVVCGGPESIGLLGFQRPPQWRGEAVYLPAYAPLYGRAAGMLAAVERLIERRAGLWLPIVLHWGWEAEDGWEALERLAELIAPYAARWQDFGAAVERSRGAAPLGAEEHAQSGGAR